MSEAVEIRSTATDAALVIEAPNSDHGVVRDYPVHLRGPVVNATVLVAELEASPVGAFFRELASSWRGWDGTKAAESLEGQLHLEASSDQTGHVSLRVSLRDDFGRGEWVAQGTLILEAGQLESIAEAVNRVVG